MTDGNIPISASRMPKASSQASDAPATIATGIVVIGRNEGERLVACLSSLPAGLPVVYVDSGSTDGSAAHAASSGAVVVALDMSRPFSAARARNEGFAQLVKTAPSMGAVQFLDGDTVLQPRWLAQATQFLETSPKVVAVAGRRREIRPETSFYNQLCDDEWDTPIGETAEIGGDALYRVGAFAEVGGFDPNVIAGEEPELCLRLRRQGGLIYRLDEEMTLHDAAITGFPAWWQRAVRSGYASALGALMHGRNGYRLRQTARPIFWGAALPLLALLVGLTAGPLWGAAVLLVYPAQWLRLWWRHRHRPAPAKRAWFMIVANLAEMVGVARCVLQSATGTRTIIEYK